VGDEMSAVNGVCVSREAKNFSWGQGVWASSPKVTSVRDVRLDIRLPFFRPWKPGQFVMIRWGRHLVGRPFAIVDWKALSKEESLLSIWVRRLGAGTAELTHIRAGDPLWVTAPLGEPFTADILRAPRLLLVSGGVGAASVLPLAMGRGSLPKDLWIHGDRDADSLDRDLVSSTFRPTQLCLEVCPPSSTGFHPGRVTDVIRSLSAEHVKGVSAIVACGPSPMLDAVAKCCAQHESLKNLPVVLGLEERMGCGIGLCFSCSVWTKDGMKRLCTEGPWFKANDIPEHFRMRGGE
jgi:dihydroorotate dehydrogenase electron transfer subunit